MIEMAIPISAFESVDSITTLTRSKGYYDASHAFDWSELKFVHLINYDIRQGKSLSLYLGHQDGTYGRQIFIRKFTSLSAFLQRMPEIEADVKKALFIKFS